MTCFDALDAGPYTFDENNALTREKVKLLTTVMKKAPRNSIFR